MNAFTAFRQSAVATLALGVVLFTLTGLDTTLTPSFVTTHTTAQVMA